jgi:hypothetical protein
MIKLETCIPKIPLDCFPPGGNSCPPSLVLPLLQGVWTSVFVLYDISLLSDGLGQCKQVPPNLSQCSDAIWRSLYQKKILVWTRVFFFISSGQCTKRNDEASYIHENEWNIQNIDEKSIIHPNVCNSSKNERYHP